MSGSSLPTYEVVVRPEPMIPLDLDGATLTFLEKLTIRHFTLALVKAKMEGLPPAVARRIFEEVFQ